jgi:hypothetical protein
MKDNKDKDKNKNKEQLPSAKPRKKTYRQPQLQVYGNLREITQSVGVAGVLDNAGAGPGKTH